MTPFKEKTEMLIFDKILNEELKFSNRTPSVAQDLIVKLLDKKPENRIGFEDMEDLKNHPFFKGINFDDMENILPPDESVIQIMKSPLKLRKTMSHAKLSVVSKDYIKLKIDEHEIDDQIEKNNKLSKQKSCKNIIDCNKIEEDEHSGLGYTDKFHENREKKLDHKNTMTTINSKCNELNQIKYDLRKSSVKRASKLETKGSKQLNKMHEETLVLECK